MGPGAQRDSPSNGSIGGEVRPLVLFIKKTLLFWGSLAQAHGEQPPLSLSLPNSGELRVRGSPWPTCHPQRASEAPRERREVRRFLHQGRNWEAGVSLDTTQEEEMQTRQVEKAVDLARFGGRELPLATGKQPPPSTAQALPGEVK